MLTDEIRSRLEELNRQPLVKARVEPCPASFPAAVPGEEHENSSGKHWRLQQPLEKFWPEAARRIACLRPLPELPEWSLGQAEACHAELAAFAESFPRGALFLDLETCGFAGSMVFLIGLIRSTDAGLVLDQLFARNYAEERAILQTLWEIAAENQVLVTFNGKSFDWPMVHDRSILHRLDRDGFMPGGGNTAIGEPGLRPLVHCDVLHHARRKWKGLLPNCKLQTLERFVCRRQRREDIGGAHIPLAYHEFVRGGNWGPLRSVLHHNALDLATLVEVALSLACPEKAAAEESLSRSAAAGQCREPKIKRPRISPKEDRGQNNQTSS